MPGPDRRIRWERTNIAERVGVIGCGLMGSGTLRHLRLTTDVGELADGDLVLEAVAEDEPLKVEIFGMIHEIVKDPDATLATRSRSSLCHRSWSGWSRLASLAARRGRDSIRMTADRRNRSA